MMLSDVCLSVAYIGPKSRTERPRKTKGQMSKSQRAASRLHLVFTVPTLAGRRTDRNGISISCCQHWQSACWVHD